MHERALSPSSEKSKDPFEEGGKGTTNREEEREREERRVTWPQRCATGDGEQAAAHKEIAVRCFRREAAAEILLLLRWASPPSLAPRGSTRAGERPRTEKTRHVGGLGPAPLTPSVGGRGSQTAPPDEPACHQMAAKKGSTSGCHTNSRVLAEINAAHAAVLLRLPTKEW